MIIILAAMTIALVLGIKYYVADDSASAPQQSAEKPQQLFKEPPDMKPSPVYNPAVRSETGSGGGLEMFTKTNAGYSGEETSSDTTSTKNMPPEVKKSTAAATHKKPVKQARTTVIPRLQGAKTFGASGATDMPVRPP